MFRDRDYATNPARIDDGLSQQAYEKRLEDVTKIFAHTPTALSKRGLLVRVEYCVNVAEYLNSGPEIASVLNPKRLNVAQDKVKETQNALANENVEAEIAEGELDRACIELDAAYDVYGDLIALLLKDHGTGDKLPTFVARRDKAAMNRFRSRAKSESAQDKEDQAQDQDQAG